MTRRLEYKLTPSIYAESRLLNGFYYTPIERVQTLVFRRSIMSGLKKPRLLLTILCLAMFVLPTVLATVPVEDTSETEEGWWVETTVDRDGNGIGDMIEVHQKNPTFLDEDKTLPLIIDFSYKDCFQIFISLAVY